jgi:ATP-dependent helicase/DNAse subunit B
MKTLYCGNFAQLQARFIAEVTAARERDALAPLDVVVTGQLARLALRRELARAGCSHANVHFLTLHELAESEAALRVRQEKLRLLSDVARGPLMLRAVELASPLLYFSALSTREGFRSALWRTLNELRGSGVSGEALARAANRRSAQTGVLARKLRDLAGILVQLERLLQEHRYADPIRLLQLACEVESDHCAPLILYGRDEMSALERRFVEKLTRRRAITVYLPYREEETFFWVKPFFTALTKMGFAAEFLPEESAAREIFLVSAPTRERESEEIARELLFPDSPQAYGPRIGILVRDGEPYVPLLREELARAGVRGYIHQCHTLGETASGRAFRLLCALLDERFARADVTEFLLSSPVRWPEEMREENRGAPPVALWNQLTLLAGITAGAESWSDGLRRLQNRLAYERQAAQENDEALAAGAEHTAAVEALQRYMELLTARIREVNRARTWREKSEALWTLFDEFVETDHESAALREELSRAHELDALGVAPTLENVRILVKTMLNRPAEREGRFQAHEPTVATYAEAQGIVFDDVFLPGLVEREVPRPVSQDPLLLDDEREALEQWLSLPPGAIPRRRERRQRERFAFHAALSSARRRALLSYPRQESGGRERLPSFYLLDVLEALTGKSADYEALAQFVSSDARARRIGAGRLRTSRGQPTTPFARTLALLARALETKSSASIADLVEDHPFVARAAAAEEARFHHREFTPYDGLIKGNALHERLAAEIEARPLSPTRMEHYAECPFRYFGLHVLELSSVDEPEEPTRITPLESGLLVHEILEEFFREAQAEERLPLRRESEERLLALARRALARFERNHVTGPALLWQLEQRRILRMLTRFFERDLEDDSGFVPRYFEQQFTCDYTDGVQVSFHGKMDRVDIHPTTGEARVVDYKTGALRPGMKNGSLGGGRALQLAVYRLAAERALNLRGAAAAYYFLGDATKDVITYTEQDWETGREVFARTAATILNGVRGGRFYPYPEARKCDWCPLRTACGTGRLTFKWTRTQPVGADYLAMREADQ